MYVRTYVRIISSQWRTLRFNEKSYRLVSCGENHMLGNGNAHTAPPRHDEISNSSFHFYVRISNSSLFSIGLKLGFGLVACWERKSHTPAPAPNRSGRRVRHHLQERATTSCTSWRCAAGGNLVRTIGPSTSSCAGRRARRPGTSQRTRGWTYGTPNK